MTQEPIRVNKLLDCVYYLSQKGKKAAGGEEVDDDDDEGRPNRV